MGEREERRAGRKEEEKGRREEGAGNRPVRKIGCSGNRQTKVGLTHPVLSTIISQFHLYIVHVCSIYSEANIHNVSSFKLEQNVI